MKRVLSIIGAGNVGTVLGRLFYHSGMVGIGDIFSRTRASSARACKVIGAGQVVESVGALSPADIVMVTTSDTALQSIADDLIASVDVQKGSIFFHCSGATPSSVFSGLRGKGAFVASIHPLMTFTAPTLVHETLSGVWCGVEGDVEALAVLEPMFHALGAQTFRIHPDKKALYHAGAVFMCNYLFPLIEAGLQCYEAAGVSREVASQAVESMLHATVDNALRLGPCKAMSGPIARGDDGVIADQLRALAKFDPGLKDFYAVLGSRAAILALEKGSLSCEEIERIQRAFSASQSK
jgi:predicted short-subunit dehydrogenase-like oxidoreductase (DUF2520 family)